MKRNVNLVMALICAALIVILTLLSATSIGFDIREAVVPSLPKDQVVRIATEGQNEPNLAGPVVYSVTYTNTFLPRQHQLPFVTACLYNSDERRGAFIGTRWQVSQFDSQQWSEGNVVQLGIETKTVGFEVQPFVRWAIQPMTKESHDLTREVPVKPIPGQVIDKYDLILLFIEEGRSRQVYPQCEFLQAEDVERARKVQLV
ncbi:MAG TPA: hypothetical protein VJJ82_03240 [Candidatus Nanoarchaeia archaeon]|nr:hypothetical protein [Candidatus Nanoarchaeia archaeon]